MFSKNMISSMKTLTNESESSRSTTTSSSSSIINSVLSVGPGYKFLQKIGSGNFGEIWIAKNISNDEKVAIKTEKNRNRSSKLASEFRIYKLFGINEFTPAIFHFCKTHICRALVMELMGPSLEEIFKQNHLTFTVKTVILIGLQLFKIFEFVHSRGIIYRDVKPHNFVIGLGSQKSKFIFILDFGLSKEYMNPVTKSHIPYKENVNLTGTARYMSINTHLGREQSRRDDIESCLHMLIYFLRGNLPWQGLVIGEGEDHCMKICSVKQQTSIEFLCKELHSSWATLLLYARTLGFYEKPDYAYMSNLLHSHFRELNYTDETFDWDGYSSLSSHPSFMSNTFESSDPGYKSSSRANFQPCLNKKFSNCSKSGVFIPSNPERDVFKSYCSRIDLLKPQTSFFHRVRDAFCSFISLFTSCGCKKKRRLQSGFSLHTNC